MKEIRGAGAVKYARENGIDFDIDEAFLERAEGEILGRPATMADVNALFEERLGSPYDPADVTPGEESFDFMVARYGDDWIYVAVEGKDPAGEEGAALRLFRRPLKEKDPRPGGDILSLYTRYSPRLKGTGLPAAADLNLLFHAALRLAGRGELVAEVEPAEGEGESYGNRRFLVPTDAEVSLQDALCELCLGGRGETSIRLHVECARRLRKVVAEVTAAGRLSRRG